MFNHMLELEVCHRNTCLELIFLVPPPKTLGKHIEGISMFSFGGLFGGLKKDSGQTT